MIEWKTVQQRLTAAGYPCGAPDGVRGPLTFTALHAFAAGRKADAAIQLRGRVAADKYDDYGMTTRARIAEFIAQCCNETGGYRRFVENLNYSVQAMLAGS